MSFHKIREALEAALNTPIIYTGGIEEPIATCGFGGDVGALKDKLEAAIALLDAMERPDTEPQP